MKRVGDLYEKIYDIENLRLAHKQARKGKSFYTEVKLVDQNEDEYLYKLRRCIDESTSFLGTARRQLDVL